MIAAQTALDRDHQTLDQQFGAKPDEIRRITRRFDDHGLRIRRRRTIPGDQVRS
jgi:hypothetical protein